MKLPVVGMTHCSDHEPSKGSAQFSLIEMRLFKI